MTTPANNLGGGKGNKHTQASAARGKDARPPAAGNPAEDRIVVPKTDDADLKMHVVEPGDSPEVAAGKVDRLKAVTEARAAAAYAAAKAVHEARKNGKGLKDAEAKKTELDELMKAAGAVLDASHRLARRIIESAAAKTASENESLAGQRKDAFHAASDRLSAAREAMETEFKAIEKTMREKRAQVQSLDKALRQGFNLGDWAKFDTAVKEAHAFADQQSDAAPAAKAG